jgi:hypothetical protein
MNFYVARRKNNNLYLFINKEPQLKNNRWCYIENGFIDFGIKIGKELLPHITFENSPQEVTLETLNK